MASVTRFIERRLRLKVNESKSAVARPEPRHFLGYRLHPQSVGPPDVLLSGRSVKRLRERIRELTQRSPDRALRSNRTLFRCRRSEMKVKVFTLPWRPDGGGFDDTEVEAFLEERTVIDVSEHFFVHEKTPVLVLVLVLTYRGGVVEFRSPRQASKGAAPDASADLTPEERPRYEALRTWRNQYARRTGKPPYVVFTNRQAAELALRAPSSRTQLGEIPGIGKSRIDDFGEELLAFMATLNGATLASRSGGGDGSG